ncbi:hypothetical protein OTU49_012530, partial [Cherax quadricarinatus]
LPPHSSQELVPPHSSQELVPPHSSQELVPPHSSQELVPPHSSQELVPPHSSQELVPPHSSQELVPPHSSQELVPPHSSQELVPPHSSQELVPPHSSQDESMATVATVVTLTATTITTSTSMATMTTTTSTATTSTATVYVATPRSRGRPRGSGKQKQTAIPVATRRPVGRPKGSKTKRYVTSVASTSMATSPVASISVATSPVATSPVACISMATSLVATSVASTSTATPDVANSSMATTDIHNSVERDSDSCVASDIPVSTPAPAGVSSAKKRVSLFDTIHPHSTGKRLMIVDRRKLYTDIFSHVVCPKCRVASLKPVYYEQHLESTVVLECIMCPYKLGEKPRSYKTLNAVTGRMVYGELLAGRGYRAFVRRNAVCSLPHISLETYNKYASMITEKSVESCKKILAESKDIIVQEYRKLNIVPDDAGILDIDVTYDGTWHTRGHHSNIGIGVAIDALTKLVVDYQIFSKYCNMCSFLENRLNSKKITNEKYEEFRKKHELECNINYSGTSAKMESEAAVMMWERSLENKLRYKTIVSDGDSNTYKAIADLNDGEGPYPGVNVEKEECINHYAKRLKNRLIDLVKSQYVEKELKTGRKRKEFAMKKMGMLTDFVIDKLTHYFQKNLREKINHDVEDMRNSIMASFFHCSSTDEKPQHHLCPTGDNSWCFYQKAVAANLPPPSHTTMKVQLQLEPAYMKKVHNIYKDLTTDEMMRRCVKGRTQNANESLHQRIWSYCNKTLFRTKRQADFAASHAVAEYNSGYVRSCLDIPLGYGRSAVTQKHLEKMDKNMQVVRTRKSKKRKRGQDMSYEPGGH